MERERSAFIFVDETTSTNHEIKSMRTEGRAFDGMALVAGHQTAGRGQGSNRWISEKGLNITLSLYIKPFVEASEQFRISQAVSLGIRDFLCLYLDDVAVKWPNDIYWKNKKIAGILIENTILGNQISDSIIGIGLNINQTAFSTEANNAISLKMITGNTFNLAECIELLVMQVKKRLVALNKEPLDSLQNEYLQSMLGFNEEQLFRDDDTEFKGIVTGTDQFGRLQVEREGGTKLYSFGEIVFIFPDPDQ